MNNYEKTLGHRMKEYEAVTDLKLIKGLPVIIRLDGRAFHTFTEGFHKPFDVVFNDCMTKTMKILCESVSNCVFGYTQSDEITLVLYEKDEKSEPWFDNRLQKLVSLTASIATLAFNEELYNYYNDQQEEIIPHNKLFKATFDARAFNIPKDDVVNNLIWRQNDAAKNSINSVAQAHFSHKELQGKNGSQMQDMLMLQKQYNWSKDTPTRFKRGSACIKQEVEIETPQGKTIRTKWVIDNEMPMLVAEKSYLENLLRRDCCVSI